MSREVCQGMGVRKNADYVQESVAFASDFAKAAARNFATADFGHARAR